MLEYISTEENEYLYIDGVSADEMPMEQLINIYKECMKSISTKPKCRIKFDFGKKSDCFHIK